MSDYGSSDQAYYRDYYKRMGSVAYKGESQKLSSRMQVFCDWLRAEQMRKEAVQVAAMALRFIVDICEEENNA